ncbi:hypothetical protein [Thermosporothrix hazakensis]|nr:hypothetical protein [Thermosporothrix hazakensis]GCE50480.1 hypothetical protein KTH_53490 [Thermosporothrix hazakensis]
MTLRVQDFRDVLANITENEVMLRVDEAGIWIGDFFLPNTLMF